MAKVREETLSLCDDKIHPRVKIAGSGPALLYLHGDYGLIWNEFLDKLAEHFTVYAPEHPGTTPGDPDGLKPLDDMWDLVLYNYDADKIIRITWMLACVGKFIWPIPDKGLKKRMHRIKAPTLIVWGKQDRLIPPVYAEDFRKGIAGAKVELIDNASHMLTFEQ